MLKTEHLKITFLASMEKLKGLLTLYSIESYSSKLKFLSVHSFLLKNYIQDTVWLRPI